MDSQKNITMPVILADEKKSGENCSIRYDNSGKEIGRECYPQNQQVVSFVGLKQFSSSVTAGINETFSQDYTSRFSGSNNVCKPCFCDSATDCACPACVSQPSGPLSPWDINSYSMRVGYAGNALFFLSDKFGHFMLPSNGISNYVEFN